MRALCSRVRSVAVLSWSAAFALALPPQEPAASEQLAAVRARLSDARSAQRSDAPALLDEAARVLAGIEAPESPEMLELYRQLDGAAAECGAHETRGIAQEWILAHLELTRPADDAEVLDARTSLAMTRRRLGDLPRALELLTSVLAAEERKRANDDPRLAEVRAKLAVTKRKAGDYEGALALQEQVLASRSALPADDPLLFEARNDLALTQRKLGNLESAIALQEQILASRLELDANGPLVAEARTNLGLMKRSHGDLAGARALMEQVLPVLERTLPAGHRTLAVARRNLAQTMFTMGDVAEALELQARVVAALELPADHPQRLLDEQQLAMMKARTGDFAGAVAIQEKALAVLEGSLPEGHPRRLLARSFLAETHVLAGDLQRALELEESVLAWHRDTTAPHNPRRLRALGNVALLKGELGDHAAALELAELALAARERTRAADHPDTLGARDRVLRARRAAEEGAGELWGLQMAGVSAQLDAAFALDPQEARTLVEDAAVWIDTLLLTDPAERGGARNAELFTLVETQRSLRIRAAGPRAPIGVAGALVDARSLARTLPHGSAAVAYVHSRNGAVSALVLTPDARVQRIDLAPLDRIEALLRAWSGALGRNGVDAEERESARDLRRTWLDPVLDAAGLVEEGALFVRFDDALPAFPLDALALDENDAGEDVDLRVGDRFEIHCALAFSHLLARSPARTAKPSLLVLRNADFDRALEDSMLSPRAGAFSPPVELAAFAPFAALPIGDGANAIESIFARTNDSGAVTLAGADADKARLMAAARGKRFVHLATRAWSAPSSILSQKEVPRPHARGFDADLKLHVEGLTPTCLHGLCLSGANRGRHPLGRVPGLLTAGELAALDLEECALVVLTAPATRPGVLRRAAHSAGARAVLAPVWEVDDTAARELCAAFYAHLWQRDLSPSDALRQAQRSLRERGHPVRDWGAWLVTGDAR